MIKDKNITIHIANLVGGKYWVATSPDVLGLYISGMTREDVLSRIDDELLRIKQLETNDEAV